MKLLIDPWHSNEEGGSGHEEVLQNAGDVGAEPNLARKIGRDVMGGETLRDMRKWEVGHHARPRTYVCGPADRLGGPDHISMGDHHALGGACRSRRVDQGCESIGVDSRHRSDHGLGVFAEPFLAPDEQLVPAQHPVGGLVVLGARHQDHIAKVGKLGPDLIPPFHEVEVLEDRHRCLAVVGDVLDLTRLKRRVDGYPRRSGMNCGVVGDDVLRSIAGHDRNEFAVAHSQGLKPGSRLVDYLVVLLPGDVLPVAILPVDRRLVPIPLRVTVEEVDNRLAFDFGIDGGTFVKDGLFGHDSSGTSGDTSGDGCFGPEHTDLLLAIAQ